jgi:hypothetical protein
VFMRRQNWRRRPVFPLILPPGDRLQEGEEPPTAKGKAIKWSDADINAMSVVTPTDQRKAREDWIDKTIPRYRGLVDATEEGPEDDGS